MLDTKNDAPTATAATAATAALATSTAPVVQPTTIGQPQEDNAAKPVATTLEDLLAEYAPSAKTFTVTINGRAFTGNVVADSSEMLAIEKHAAKVQKVAAGKGAPAAWKPYLPAAPEIIRQCVYLEAVLTNPALSFVEWLTLAKNAAVGFVSIFTAIDPLVSGITVRRDCEDLDEAKNESSETVSGGRA